MFARATSAPRKQPVIWVLVADGRQAQVYECRRVEKTVPMSGTTRHAYSTEEMEWDLAPCKNMSQEAESLDGYQLGHDRRGSTSSSMSPVHNTYEPHGDIREELKRHFVKAIAAKLGHAFQQKAFDRLILVAPAKMIGELREQLAPDVQRCVAAVLPKDLMAYDKKTLLTHLQDTLAEVHVA